MRIQDAPHYIKPYEKFETYGVETLTDTELLAILIKSGTRECNVVELSHQLLCGAYPNPHLIHLYDYTFEMLIRIIGIGKVKAMQILSVLELSKRLARARLEEGPKFSTPSHIATYFMNELGPKKEEHFLVLFLDAKCKMIGHEIISKGSLTASIVHPREVYKRAISRSAHSIIALHNHPSGDPTPSSEDIQITKRLKEVGQIVGIPVIDHIILGSGNYRSLKEIGYL